jgi:hypothetical protein
MCRRINRAEFGFNACRSIAKKIVGFPVLRRPDGSWHKAAPAVREDAAQTASTFVAQNVRSSVQVRASSELGGSGLLQFSHVGLSSSMISSGSGRLDDWQVYKEQKITWLVTLIHSSSGRDY